MFGISEFMFSTEEPTTTAKKLNFHFVCMHARVPLTTALFCLILFIIIIYDIHNHMSLCHVTSKRRMKIPCGFKNARQHPDTAK